MLHFPKEVFNLKKLLIVEDEPDIQELLEAYLHDAGYETTIAGDGVEALAKFQKDKFDLILLDLMLPKIDGFGVCEFIRRESNVPILMLTALDGEQEQLRGFRMEIDDYVTKPFSMPILLQKIRAILRRSSAGKEENRCLHYRDLTLDLDEYLKDAANKITIPIEVSKKYYYSVEVGDVINDDLRVGSLLFKGSFGSWHVEVTDKQIVENTTD